MARTIVRNPRILFGEPTVEGTRISVRTIVLARYMFGSVESVQEQLPTLHILDIEAALDYYQGYCDEINVYIAENNEFADLKMAIRQWRWRAATPLQQRPAASWQQS